MVTRSGLTGELPDLPGVRERWGRDVLHCPYCHGREVRDRPIGVLATSPLAVHQALLFRHWTPDLAPFLHTAPPPTDAEREQLAARDIAIVEGEVASPTVADDRPTGVRLRTGAVVPRQALVVGPRFSANADILVSLGLDVTAPPPG